jgi:integral membrane protein
VVEDVKFLSFLRKFSLIEGLSTLTLFIVAMPLKYIYGLPLAVTIFGSLHGLLFLGLVGAFILAKDRVPLTTGLMIAGILGAVIPFGPFVVDRQLKKLGAS